MAVFIHGAEVKNPDKPLKGTWDLKAEKVWEINELKGEVLAWPTITIAAEGIIYLFDMKHGLNYIIDERGKIISTFGKKGQGPGEVNNQAWLLTLKEKLVIYDFPSKIHFFSANGQYIKSSTTSIGTIPYFFTSDTQYISAPPPTREGGKIQLVNFQEGTKKELADVSFKLISGPDRRIIVLPGLTPMLRIGFDPKNQRIYYGVDTSYTITVMDFDGNMKNIFSMIRKKSIISDSFKISTIKHHLRGSSIPTAPDSAYKIIPNEIPYFTSVQIHNGWVLVLINPLENQWKQQSIDIFSQEGKYTYRTTFTPEATLLNNLNFGETVIIKQGYLYAILEDEEGEIKLAKYKIILPE
jgi:hypothetical protein